MTTLNALGNLGDHRSFESSSMRADDFELFFFHRHDIDLSMIVHPRNTEYSRSLPVQMRILFQRVFHKSFPAYYITLHYIEIFFNVA